MAENKKITKQGIKEFFKGIGTAARSLVQPNDTDTAAVLPHNLTEDPVYKFNKLYPGFFKTTPSSRNTAIASKGFYHSKQERRKNCAFRKAWQYKTKRQK